MKSWRFYNTHEPLRYEEVPEPELQPGKVLIDVKAGGLCHSDVGLLEDEKWLASVPVRPMTPGHEIAGVITAVADDVTEFAVGDRVAICPMIEFHGYAVDGGYGPKVIASPAALVPIPDGVSYAQASAATDAGMTSHGAVMGTGQVKAGMKVGIIGVGGLGQIGARVAHLNGAEVYVAEINESLWDFAKELGAVKVSKAIGEFKDDQLDVIVDFAGFDTTRQAMEAVKFGGTVVQVGMGKLEASFDIYNLILNKVTLKGSMGGTKEDIAAVMDWMAKGELNPSITTITPEEIAEGLERLHRGEVKGRLAAVYGG